MLSLEHPGAMAMLPSVAHARVLSPIQRPMCSVMEPCLQLGDHELRGWQTVLRARGALRTTRVPAPLRGLEADVSRTALCSSVAALAAGAALSRCHARRKRRTQGTLAGLAVVRLPAPGAAGSCWATAIAASGGALMGGSGKCWRRFNHSSLHGVVELRRN